MAAIPQQGPYDHLSNGKLNLTQIRLIATHRLSRYIGNLEGPKCIIWDPAVLSGMNLVVDPDFLKELGVERMQQLPNVDFKANVRHFVFIVKPLKNVVEEVAHALKGIRDVNKDRHINAIILCVPKKIDLAQKWLSTPQYKGILSAMHDIGFHLYPLDGDLMTLNLRSTFQDLHIDKDPTPLFNIASALMDIQSVYGPIPKIVGKGPNAAKVAEILFQMRESLYPNGQIPSDCIPQLSSVILIDRSVDLLTPLFTQLTLEGLIDEIYGIEENFAIFPAESFSEEVKKALGKSYNEVRQECKIKLTSNDDLYSNLRHLHVTAVGSYVKRQLTEISTYFSTDVQQMSIPQMKEYTQELPLRILAKQQLSKYSTVGVLVKNETQKDEFLDFLYAQQDLRHGDCGDKPLPFIEACIRRRADLNQILRLICIQSLVNNGLKPKLLDYYEKEILQMYGYQFLTVFTDLKKAGLLAVQEGGGKAFQAVKKQFRLLTETKDHDPDDISYVHSGYAPLSVRFIEMLTRSHGIHEFAEQLKLLPGPIVEKYQTIPKGLVKNKTRRDEKPIVLVFFIGGCTFAEVAALKFLSSFKDEAEYVVATTSIIHGKRLMRSFLDRAPRSEHSSYVSKLKEGKGNPRVRGQRRN